MNEDEREDDVEKKLNGGNMIDKMRKDVEERHWVEVGGRRNGRGRGHGGKYWCLAWNRFSQGPAPTEERGVCSSLLQKASLTVQPLVPTYTRTHTPFSFLDCTGKG